MLAKKPEQRYPTPQRAAQALEVFLVAEREAPKAEEAPQLSKYLTWLEMGAKEEPKEELVVPEAVMAPFPVPVATPASPGVLPVAQTMPAPPLVAPPVKPGTAPASAPRERKKHRRHRQRSDEPPAMAAVAPAATFAVPAVAAASSEDIDVELVPMDAPELVSTRGPGLSRRDWLLLGFGAAAVLAAVLLGWVLAVAFQ